MWNGIKIDGKLYKAHYSEGALTNYEEGTLTIYAKEYSRFPKIEGLTIYNDSDIMTDYFEEDQIRVTPDNVFYNQVQGAISKANKHYNKKGDTMKISAEILEKRKSAKVKRKGFLYNSHRIYFMECKGKDVSFDRWRIAGYYAGHFAETVFLNSETEYNEFIKNHKAACYSDYSEFRIDADLYLKKIV
jgi:Fe2+ or Zn2+ uptake regulation protein